MCSGGVGVEAGNVHNGIGAVDCELAKVFMASDAVLIGDIK
jgi:hypothetical protein